MRACLASLHPRILSGQIDSLAGLGRALLQHGHCVTLVAPFDTDGLLDGTLATLDTGPQELSKAAVCMLRTIPRIVDASREADLLHLALPTPAFSWVADLVHKLSSVPMVVAYEGHLAPAMQLLQPERMRRSWKTYLPLLAINNGIAGRISRYRCPAYVVSSEYQRAELMTLGASRDRVTILPNLIETSKMTRCEPAAARERLGLPPGQALVGYLGHFNDVKGVDLLAAAFTKLSRDDRSAHLVLAWSGQGNEARIRTALSRVEDRVSWLGKVPVGTFLSAIDTLALPYRSSAGQGAFPSLVLEALYAGCPLVTTRLPLLEEVVTDGETALLFPRAGTQQLSEQLARLLGDRRLRRSMARAQREAFRTRFSAGLLVERYEELYGSLLSAPSYGAAESAA